LRLTQYVVTILHESDAPHVIVVCLSTRIPWSGFWVLHQSTGHASLAGLHNLFATASYIKLILIN